MAGNQGSNRIVWEQWQLDFLEANWRNLTAQQISDALGIKRTKVREKKYEMGFYSLKLEYWTPEQIEFLRQNYREYGDSELAEIFETKWRKQKGWTKKHIEKKRRQLRLKRTPIENKRIHERNVAMGRFSNCAVHAWQKRGVTEVGTRKMWTGIDGRQFMVVKLKSGFVHYANWLWKQVFGEVPAGCCVRLRDGNPENVTVANLMLVTRAEHAAINSVNRNPQITTARKLIYQIKKISKEHEKQIK